MAAKVLVITMLLVFSGFGSGKPQTVWRLWRLSACVGILAGFVRALQLKQRLFSSLHEGFYCYFITFVVGLILTLRPLDRLPNAKPTPEKEASTEELNEQMSDKANNNNNLEENNNNITDASEKKKMD
ncbi:hypothetical protein OESDEN_07437 [Oesophagostomum dentatum]|uniref:Uncharacterized protein n=1 Tax=Oesophagostomum dentatum TaxID=61180 RepID=A0A0B1T978_OESDE|nr:hypothetical protein OESDEN_07437 [Oesophagostomum dentatum]